MLAVTAATFGMALVDEVIIKLRSGTARASDGQSVAVTLDLHFNDPLFGQSGRELHFRNIEPQFVSRGFLFKLEARHLPICAYRFEMLP